MWYPNFTASKFVTIVITMEKIPKEIHPQNFFLFVRKTTPAITPKERQFLAIYFIGYSASTSTCMWS